jgi:hypothetical protein
MKRILAKCFYIFYNIEMLHTVTGLEAITRQTRQDFERRNISGEELALAAEFSGIETVYRAIFPEFCCELATLVLRQRIGQGEVLDGGYQDWGEYGSSHTFLYLGETAIGDDTIADITADQFEDKAPPVYIGRFVLPWMRSPKYRPISLPGTGEGFALLSH